MISGLWAQDVGFCAAYSHRAGFQGRCRKVGESVEGVGVQI